MMGTRFSISFVLSGILLLRGLTALAQGEADGSDMGADPGLPAEAPVTPPAAPAPQTVKPTPSATLPAPESMSPPHEGAAPAPAPAQKPAAAPKPRPLTGKLGELNLSTEQTQQIIDIRRQAKLDAERRLKEEFNFLKQNLAQAMADNSTGEEVRRRFEVMQKKYLELQTMKFEKLLRIREVLTPEQRKKFAELRSRPTGKNNNNNDND